MKYKYDKYAPKVARTGKLRRCANPECDQLKPEESFFYNNRRDNKVCGVCGISAPPGKPTSTKRWLLKQGYKKHGLSKREGTTS